MKKGFTLVELLGVVILLSLIMLIAFPILLNITNTKKELTESEKQIIYAGTSTYITKYQNNYEKINGNIYCVSVLDLEKEQLIQSNLSEAYSYVQVNVNQEKYEYELKDTCIPDYFITINYIVIGEPFNQKNWANKDFYIDIVALGADKIKWCTSDHGECEPVALIEGEKASILMSNESASNQICAIAYIDNQEKTKECSELYKLDKTPPQFAGVDNTMVYLDNPFNVSNHVSVSDSLSGMEGSYNYDPLSIDNTKIATATVTYSATDQAGNRARITRDIEVKNPYSIYITSNSISVYDISTYNEQTKLIDVYTLFFQSELELKKYEDRIYVYDIFPYEHFAYLDIVSADIIEDSIGIQKFNTLKNKAEQYNSNIIDDDLMPNFTVSDIASHLLKSNHYNLVIKDGYYQNFYLYRTLTSIANLTSHNTTLKNGTATNLYYSLVKSTVEIDGDMNEEYEWMGWSSVSYPQYGLEYGDNESYEEYRRHGIFIPDKVDDIMCRAVKFPQYTFEELGQTVTCDKKNGLICRNKDQIPGNFVPDYVCLNYEITIRYKVPK